MHDIPLRIAILGLLTVLGSSTVSIATAQGVNWNGANYPNQTYPQLLERHAARTVAEAIANHGFKQVRLPFGDALISKWSTPLPADLASSDHRYLRADGAWVTAGSYGDLYKSAISELAERGVELVLDYHPYTDDALGVDQGFWKYNIWNAWTSLLDLLSDGTAGLHGEVRARIIGADIFNEPHESQFQSWIDRSTDAGRMIATKYRDPGTFPNLKVYMETPLNWDSSQTAEGGWAWSLFDTMQTNGLNPQNSVVEIHIYPFNHPFTWDAWEMALFDYNPSREVRMLPTASVQSLIEHRVAQARAFGYAVVMGEYGSEIDSFAGAIARACEALNIQRFRWVLYESGTYGVFDADLQPIGARTPDAELR